jgi:hypothetical protein
MDSWILKQLRALILSDLKDHIPKDYFDEKIENLPLNDTFKSHEYLSYEKKWGCLVGKLGQKLYFQPPLGISPRQVAASEILMNLGMLAATEASLSATEQIYERAKEKEISDGNAGVVAAQLKNEHIPIFQDNVRGGLKQYIHHLTPEEAKPYISLLHKDQQQVINYMAQESSKVVHNTINIAGSVDGDIQAGETNDNTKIEHSGTRNIYKWLLNTIVTLVIAVSAGVIVIYLTT